MFITEYPSFITFALKKCPFDGGMTHSGFEIHLPGERGELHSLWYLNNHAGSETCGLRCVY